jgi:hypothetical protein
LSVRLGSFEVKPVEEITYQRLKAVKKAVADVLTKPLLTQIFNLFVKSIFICFLFFFSEITGSGIKERLEKGQEEEELSETHICKICFHVFYEVIILFI